MAPLTPSPTGCRLSRDKEAFLETQRWRYTPLDKLSPGFRKMVLTRGSPAPHTQVRAEGGHDDASDATQRAAHLLGALRAALPLRRNT